MRVQVHIWDTAGQERFKSLTTQGAQGALLVFDVMSPQSFDAVQQWLRELTDNTQPNCQIALISNKCDLLENQKPVIKQEEVKKFAEQNGLIYFETSSYWDRQQIQVQGERGGIGYLVQSMVENVVREFMNEDEYDQSDKTDSSAKQSQRYQKQDQKQYRGGDENAKVLIKDKKMMGGRDKTEIRVSGIRLDKESMFEVDNKQESNSHQHKLKKNQNQNSNQQNGRYTDAGTLAKVSQQKNLDSLKLKLLGKNKPSGSTTKSSSSSKNDKNQSIKQSDINEKEKLRQKIEEKKSQLRNENKSKESEEDKMRKYREQLELNASFALILKSEQPKTIVPKYEEYDPLGIDTISQQALYLLRSFYSPKEQPSDLISQIDQKIRKELNIISDPNDMRKRLEREHRLQEELQRQRNQEKKRQEKLKQKQKNGIKPNNGTILNTNKQIEAQKLKSKLQNKEKKQKIENTPDQQKQHQLKEKLEESQIYCARCRKFHGISFHKNQTNGKPSDIKMSLDEETKGLRPSVNIINSIKDKKSANYDERKVQFKQNSRDMQREERRVYEPSDKHRQLERPQKQTMRYDDYGEESEGNLSFIVDDDEELDPHTQKELDQLIGKRRKRYVYREYDSESDDMAMEAGYDDIEFEEKISSRIARLEDEEQLRLINEEKKREKMLRKKRRRIE
ncbi:rab2 gtpase [Stylonychia lemnae]|uniref:Rab2 gtpase n=1 Tax=Stylonychia lemnae TaxID=5949 RepID=A0A078A116_STYLE|nr:rab2 gtpase [Stylonychia lemnae]|eukprot:CDW75547.1 rab2 gtpase [Stylonychia lemnae]